MKKSIMNKMVATTSPSTPTSKRSRKPLLAVIVIILIVALAVGAYLATRGNDNTPSTTPTPTPSSSSGANVGQASSLQYSISMTNSSGASLGTYTYYAKNAGTSDLMMRIESTDPSGESSIFIINGALQQAWTESGGQWTDISSAYTSELNTWNTAFTSYKNTLANWSGVGDWTYSSPTGESVRIYNITVNPSLPDSLFQHS